MRRNLLEKSKITSRDYDALAKAPFLIAALGGFALVMLLKELGIHQGIVTLFACIAIISYWAIVANYRALRLREDQMGDNVYYLGFLYTLASLSHALYAFNKDANLDRIVGDFGLALATTIVGVALRVHINQLRTDPIETEHTARIELADAVRRMRGEIDDAVEAIQRFYLSLEQSTKEGIDKTVSEANTSLEQGVDKVATASNLALKNIEDAMKGFSSNAKQLEEISSLSAQNFEKLSIKISNIEMPSDLLSKKFEPVFVEINKLSDRLAQRLEADDRLLRNYIEKTDIPSEIVLERMEPLLQSIDKVADRLNNRLITDEKIMNNYIEKAEKIDLIDLGLNTVYREKAKHLSQKVIDMKKLANNIEKMMGSSSEDSRENLFQRIWHQGSADYNRFKKDISKISGIADELNKSLNEVSDLDTKDTKDTKAA